MGTDECMTCGSVGGQHNYGCPARPEHRAPESPEKEGVEQSEIEDRIVLAPLCSHEYTGECKAHGCKPREYMRADVARERIEFYRERERIALESNAAADRIEALEAVARAYAARLVVLEHEHEHAERQRKQFSREADAACAERDALGSSLEYIKKGKLEPLWEEVRTLRARVAELERELGQIKEEQQREIDLRDAALAELGEVKRWNTRYAAEKFAAIAERDAALQRAEAAEQARRENREANELLMEDAVRYAAEREMHSRALAERAALRADVERLTIEKQSARSWAAEVLIGKHAQETAALREALEACSCENCKSVRKARAALKVTP